MGKVCDDDSFGDESYNGGGIYDVLVVQYQAPNLPELTNHLQSEQLAFLILHSLAVFELLFELMLWLPQIQDN
ncbi:MAG: hypothetical protein HC773_14160 [Scytonema sp. CRU_2_7]|nr:hypothetical protein [Scytonema sp. CRU_2_7]